MIKIVSLSCRKLTLLYVFKVSDFTWSHDGTQALISYRDGFVLVGSVSGQRHWSSEINLESQITCGIWTPDDQQVMLLNCHCALLLQLELEEEAGGERCKKPLTESTTPRPLFSHCSRGD